MTDTHNLKIGDEGIIVVPKDAPATYNLIQMWAGERVQVTALTDPQARPFVFHDPLSDTDLSAIQVELLGIMTFNLPPECLTLVTTTASDKTRVVQLQAVIDEAFSILADADDWDALDKALTLPQPLHAHPSA